MLRTHKLSERHANGAGPNRWDTISHLTTPQLCRPVVRHALSCDTPNQTHQSTYDYCRLKRIRRHKDLRDRNQPQPRRLKNGTRMNTDRADFRGSRKENTQQSYPRWPTPPIHPRPSAKSAKIRVPFVALTDPPSQQPATSIQLLTTDACRHHCRPSVTPNPNRDTNFRPLSPKTHQATQRPTRQKSALQKGQKNRTRMNAD